MIVVPVETTEDNIPPVKAPTFIVSPGNLLVKTIVAPEIFGLSESVILVSESPILTPTELFSV